MNLMEFLIKYRIHIFVLLTALLIFYIYSRESFSTRREKADSVAKWLNNGGGDYKDYRDHTEHNSNIVEYYDVKRALADKAYVTSDDVMKLL